MKRTILAGTILCACLAVALYASKAQAHRTVKHVERLRDEIEVERSRVATLSAAVAASERPAKLKEVLAKHSLNRSTSDVNNGPVPDLSRLPSNMVVPTVDRVIRVEDLGQRLPQILDRSAQADAKSPSRPAP